MATYLRPGVFIQETLLPLTSAVTTTSDAIPAFVGVSTQGGPTIPTLVSSWSQFQALYGPLQSTNDLGYAVYSFFLNGGNQCYIVRAVASDAVAASLSVLGTQTTPADVLVITASSPGVWASSGNSQVTITISPSTDKSRFDLVVQVGSGSTLVAQEAFLSLTLDPTDSRNAISIVNSTVVGSKYVTLATETGWVWESDYSTNPAAVSAVPLTGGSDGVAAVALDTTAELLASVNGNINLNVPGLTDDTTLNAILTWAEDQGNVFVVIDTTKPAAADSAAIQASDAETLQGTLNVTSYGALYAPWLYINDPASSVRGAMRLTAPGGAVLGQYSRSDVTRGVEKAPAGIGTVLSGVIGLTATFSGTELDTLNQDGVNAIRAVPGVGYCVMGARTLDPGMPDRYINIRRSLMQIENDLVNLCQFAIFEPNDSDLWATIVANISQYLTAEFQAGVLAGDTVADAFFVTCDDTNNTPTSVASGTVNVSVGVALDSPAEFIVINVGLSQTSTTVSESA